MVDRATNESSLESMVLALLDSQVVREDQVASTVQHFGSLYFPELDEDSLQKVTLRLLERLVVELELGVSVRSKDFVSWLPGRKSGIEWTRWNAYRKLLLQQGRALKVIDKLGEATDEILDLAGNPQESGDWQRRGLVIGEVQSGKTSTYIGFINKAADAGYRLFILIGGHTESLRRQTQSRVDEGFVGRDSAYMSKELRHLVEQKLVGVGSIDPSIRAYGFTTVTSDFSIRSAQSFNFEVSEDMSEPVVLVVKKNTRILNNLRDWLHDQAPTGGHRMPLLLLDDEADYASINTRIEDDPTAVNGAIRDLLALSHRGSYVGFTATPFANVLIDDNNDEDLFPRNFIYTLESPSNYMGADAIFSSDESEDVLRELDDAEAQFPLKHKSGLEVTELPESLSMAVAAFIVANAIRDLRGDQDEPRSMLINVSRFNDVQAQVHELVEERLAAFRNAIEFDPRDGSSDLIGYLRAAFEKEFSNLDFGWRAVEQILPEAVESMQAVLVNAKSNSAETYTKLAAAGRTRIIATGGAVLSRGLTLNGLMTSYFYQRSRAADTLMQMGRWFGYRDGYRDLCRIWIDDEVASWYSFVADSASELRSDLREMNRLNLTPKDFGLKVRKHPESLLVTAANKSKSAQLVERTISLRNKTLESAKLLADPVQLGRNLRVANELWRAAELSGRVDVDDPHIVRAVPKRLIAEFLDEFGSSASDPYFAGPLSYQGESPMAAYVRSEVDRDLQEWDLLVVSGSGDTEKLGSHEVARVKRALKLRDHHLLISGDRRRVAGPTDLAPLVARDELQRLKESASGSTRLSEYGYRSLLASPVLVLYVVDTGALVRESEESKAVPEVIVAIKVAFPADPDGVERDLQNRSGVKYLINSVLQRDWLPELFLDDDDLAELDD